MNAELTTITEVDYVVTSRFLGIPTAREDRVKHTFSLKKPSPNIITPDRAIF